MMSKEELVEIYQRRVASQVGDVERLIAENIELREKLDKAPDPIILNMAPVAEQVRYAASVSDATTRELIQEMRDTSPDLDRIGETMAKALATALRERKEPTIVIDTEKLGKALAASLTTSLTAALTSAMAKLVKEPERPTVRKTVKRDRDGLIVEVVETHE